MYQSQSACAKCHQPILKKHRHLPEVDEPISASPIPIGPAVRTLFAKRLKIRSVPIGRYVPSATDGFSIGTVAVCSLRMLREHARFDFAFILTPQYTDKGMVSAINKTNYF